MEDLSLGIRRCRATRCRRCFDPQGYLWMTMEEAVQHIKPGRSRARNPRANAVGPEDGIHPTHLDSHMATLFTNPALVAVLAKVAHEYHLPFR